MSRRRKRQDAQLELEVPAGAPTFAFVSYAGYVEFVLMLGLYGAKISFVEVKHRLGGYVVHWFGGEVPPEDKSAASNTLSMDFDPEVGF